MRGMSDFELSEWKKETCEESVLWEAVRDRIEKSQETLCWEDTQERWLRQRNVRLEV